MITSLSDIKKICNYTETDESHGGPIELYYFDNVNSSDQEYILELKRRNRESNINSLLGESDKEEGYNPIDVSSEIPSMSILVKSFRISPSKFISLDNLHNKIIHHLDSITTGQYKGHLPNLPNMDIKMQNDTNLTDYDNMTSNARAISMRIISMGNMISHSSRVGPANSVIVGTDVMKYLRHLIDPNISSNLSNFGITISNKIDPKKIIVMRVCEKNDTGGLIVVNNTTDGKYYMKESPEFTKYIAWFNII